MTYLFYYYFLIVLDIDTFDGFLHLLTLQVEHTFICTVFTRIVLGHGNALNVCSVVSATASQQERRRRRGCRALSCCHCATFR